MSRSSKLAPAATPAEQIAVILREVTTLSEKRKGQNDTKSKSILAGIFSTETPLEIKARRDREYLKELRKLLDKATTIAIKQGTINTDCSQALQDIVEKATETLGENNQALKQNVEAAFALRGSKTLPPEYSNILSVSARLQQQEVATAQTKNVAEEMAQSILTNLQEGQAKIVVAFDFKPLSNLDKNQLSSFFESFVAKLRKFTTLPIKILIEPKEDKNLDSARIIQDNLNSILGDERGIFDLHDEVVTIDTAQRSLLVDKSYLYINSISENNVLEVTGRKRFQEPLVEEPRRAQPAWQIIEAVEDVHDESLTPGAAAAASSQYTSGQSINSAVEISFLSSAQSMYDNMAAQGLPNAPDFEEEDFQAEQEAEAMRYVAIAKEQEQAQKAQELNELFFKDLSESLRDEKAAKITILEDGTATYVPALVLDISDMLDIYDQNKNDAIATLKTTGKLTAQRQTKDGVKPQTAFYYLEPNSYEQLVNLIRKTLNNDPFFRIIIKGQTTAETAGYYNLVCKLIEDEQTLKSNVLGRKSSETFGVGIEASDIIDGVILKMTPDLETELAEQNSFGNTCPQVDNFVNLGDYETIEQAAGIPTYSQLAKKQTTQNGKELNNADASELEVKPVELVYADLDQASSSEESDKKQTKTRLKPVETIYAQVDVDKTQRLIDDMRALEEAQEIDNESESDAKESLSPIADAKQLVRSSQVALQELSRQQQQQQNSSNPAISAYGSSGYGSGSELTSRNTFELVSQPLADEAVEALQQAFDSQNASSNNLPQADTSEEDIQFSDPNVKSFYDALENQIKLAPDLWIRSEGKTKAGERDGSISYRTTQAAEGGIFLQYRIVPSRMLDNKAIRYEHAKTEALSIRGTTPKSDGSPTLDVAGITTEIQNCASYTKLHTQSQESVVDVDNRKESPLPAPRTTPPLAPRTVRDTPRETKIKTVEDLLGQLSQEEKLMSSAVKDPSTNSINRTYSIKDTSYGKPKEFMTISRDASSNQISSIQSRCGKNSSILTESVDALANEAAFQALVSKMTSTLSAQQGRQSPSAVTRGVAGKAEQLSSSSLEQGGSNTSLPG